ncbi:hypothetical protein [Paraburkholderia sp.]|jgi:hypothetical protein|uniref:hypothetical protein n=1 Tax=Paraburkholderia sp. TaxID=1926495 RepID=UPI002F403303
MQQRIRTVKPSLFQHSGLFDAEHDTGLPLRLAYVGLFTCCDREGRFKWDERELKLHILPWDDLDFSRVLDALVTRGFVMDYASETGERYGVIPTFCKHQVINNRESSSELPAPPETLADKGSATREPRVPHATPTPTKRKGKERKGSKPKTLTPLRTSYAASPLPADGDELPEGTPDVETIFRFWQQRMLSPNSRLDGKRRKLIADAMARYAPREVCRAIRGCSRDPWHMGENERGRKFNSLELILRDAKHIEDFIEFDTNPPAPPPPNGHAPKGETLHEARRRTARAFGVAPQTGDVFDVPPEDCHVIGPKH